MAKYIDDVHYIAEKFLLEYSEAQANTFRTEALAAQEAKFAIIRDRVSKYFVAYKSSGAAVWSHDIKFAKMFTASQIEHFTSSLKAQGYNVTTEAQ